MTIRRPEITISAEEIRKHRESLPTISKSDSYHVLAEYYEQVDPKLLDSGVAYLPAKSVEMGKVDQPMISHIRNGVWAIIELNEALDSSNLYPLDRSVLKEVVALFVAHELHKLNEKDWKEEFDISQEEASNWAKKFGLFDFAPKLNAHDYQSVAVAQHRSIGYHSNLSTRFMLHKPWTDIADTLASIEVPCATESMQKQLDQITDDLDFYYHKFNESTGILSNLVHTGISSWAKEKGLIPLLIFERGIVYVGREGTVCKLESAQDIENIYGHFKEKLNEAHTAISDPKELQRNKSVQGSKGLYKFDNVNFFYSGLRKVLSAFTASAVIEEDTKNRKVIIDIKNNTIIIDINEPDMQYPPAKVIDIPSNAIKSIKADDEEIKAGDVVIHCSSVERKKGKYTLLPQEVEINGEKVNYSKIEINGTGLMTSQVGYRHHIKEDFCVDIGWGGEIIPYSRAISGVRMQFIEPLIKLHALETDNAVTETCKLFGVNSELTDRLSTYSDTSEDDHHKVGGFWNYSYAIARDLLDREVNGVAFKNLPANQDKLKYLDELIDIYKSKISVEDWNKLESMYLYPYKEKMLVWISENLEFNGSMAYGVFENKLNKFDAYLKGTGICKLSNDTIYDSKSPSIPSQPLSMLGYTYSNRLPIGPPQTKPKLEVSEPVVIELGLRRMGHAVKGGDKKIYYKLIPDHFYTPLLSEIFSDALGMFDGDAQTNIRAIAQKMLSSEVPVYQVLTKDLASDYGQKMLRYSGKGFKALFSTYDIIFNKSRKNDTEYWFMGTYLGMIIAATTGCRIVVSENPICATNGEEFREIVKLESPYASVKRIFGDNISLSKLQNSVMLASLIINLGYEYELDDGLMPKHLQKIRTRLFPGSAILKEIQRKYQKGNKDGIFIKKAKGYSENDGDAAVGLIDQAIRLDRSGGNRMTADSIHELADIGLKVAIPKGYEPHRVERLFRESVKAIKAKKHGDFKREDYVDAVAGSLLKMMRRAGDDQFYYKSGMYHPDKTLEFAESFVDLAFYKIADGQPGKLKQKSNDLSDGFYAATLYQRDAAFKAAKAEVESAKSTGGKT
ncbi:MAG: type I-D CRISPR-associated protein Cas10d/Csc3 [Methanotrichaceae archaeon]|nr:type I-D CRISPR-associated protein Cas10d/Csc3 [Methanotrichaceae archaeon]